jgi:hypothetical protein
MASGDPFGGVSCAALTSTLRPPPAASYCTMSTASAFPAAGSSVV